MPPVLAASFVPARAVPDPWASSPHGRAVRARTGPLYPPQQLARRAGDVVGGELELLVEDLVRRAGAEAAHADLTAPSSPT